MNSLHFQRWPQFLINALLYPLIKTWQCPIILFSNYSHLFKNRFCKRESENCGKKSRYSGFIDPKTSALEIPLISSDQECLAEGLRKLVTNRSDGKMKISAYLRELFSSCCATKQYKRRNSLQGIFEMMGKKNSVAKIRFLISIN